VTGHRHGAEIDQELRVAGAPAGALFIPHLLPVSRGMECTMYVRVASEPPLDAIFDRAYAHEPFVVLRGAEPPTLREVRGTNRCAIGWRYDASTRHVVVMTTLDNLTKGAAGQAVQCMNVVLGLAETTGLDAPALVP
jgi:N-acetyl-gamma-glutamyl-phosphate reductase